MMTSKRMKAFLLLGAIFLGLVFPGCTPEQPTQPSETVNEAYPYTFEQLLSMQGCDISGIRSIVSHRRIIDAVMPHYEKADEIKILMDRLNQRYAPITESEFRSYYYDDLFNSGSMDLYFENKTISLYITPTQNAIMEFNGAYYISEHMVMTDVGYLMIKQFDWQLHGAWVSADGKAGAKNEMSFAAKLPTEFRGEPQMLMTEPQIVFPEGFPYSEIPDAPVAAHMMERGDGTQYIWCTGWGQKGVDEKLYRTIFVFPEKELVLFQWSDCEDQFYAASTDPNADLAALVASVRHIVETQSSTETISFQELVNMDQVSRIRIFSSSGETKATFENPEDLTRFQNAFEGLKLRLITNISLSSSSLSVTPVAFYEAWKYKPLVDQILTAYRVKIELTDDTQFEFYIGIDNLVYYIDPTNDYYVSTVSTGYLKEILG